MSNQKGHDNTGKGAIAERSYNSNFSTDIQLITAQDSLPPLTRTIRHTTYDGSLPVIIVSAGRDDLSSCEYAC